MAQKQNRRAKIVGTDIELDITEKEEVIVESHDDDHIMIITIKKLL